MTARADNLWQRTHDHPDYFMTLALLLLTIYAAYILQLG